MGKKNGDEEEEPAWHTKGCSRGELTGDMWKSRTQEDDAAGGAVQEEHGVGWFNWQAIKLAPSR